MTRLEGFPNLLAGFLEKRDWVLALWKSIGVDDDEDSVFLKRFDDDITIKTLKVADVMVKNHMGSLCSLEMVVELATVGVSLLQCPLRSS